MPNRIIKETIRTSKSINKMSDFQFRLWAYLITYVDDYGRGSADPEILKGFVFPRRKGVTESTIKTALLDLANIGSINLYEVDGESYLCFPNWSNHQRIQQKKSKFPEPPSGNGQFRKPTVTHGDLPPESNPIQSEYKSESEAVSERAHDAAEDRPDFNTVEVYATSNLATMTAGNMEEFASFKADLSEELIRHAIDDTCAHGSRNWAYTRVLLQRYVEKGYKSVADVQKAAEERRKGIKTAANNPAGSRQNYTQREYGDDFGFYNPAEDYA